MDIGPTREREGRGRDPRGPLVIPVEITRLIRDVIYERTDTRRPPSGERTRRGMPPFLAIRHLSRLNQGNYGANRSKCPAWLVKSHIFAPRHVRYQRGAWIKNFWRAARDGFYEPAAGETSRSAARNFVGGGLIKQPAQERHTPQSTFPPGKTTNKLGGEYNSDDNSKTAEQTYAHHGMRHGYCCLWAIVAENYSRAYPRGWPLFIENRIDYVAFNLSCARIRLYKMLHTDKSVW